MKHLIILILSFFSLNFSILASHVYGGYMTYCAQTIDPLEYYVEVVTYTEPNAVAADRCEVVLNTGDTLFRINDSSSTSCSCDNGNCGELISAAVKKNIYAGYVQFSGAGTHVLQVNLLTYMDGIVNIPNSLNTTFTITDTLVVDNWLGPNCSPQVNYDPLFYICSGDSSRMKLGAYETEGDSVVSSLVPPSAAGGVLANEITGNQGALFEIVNDSADVLWCSPQIQGNYSQPVLIREFRDGVFIGSMTVHSFIEINGLCVNTSSCNMVEVVDTNDPPSISVFPNPLSNTRLLVVSNQQTDNFFYLYDLHGKLILKSQMHQGENNIEFSPELDGSLYFYKIMNANQSLTSGKLVIVQ